MTAALRIFGLAVVLAVVLAAAAAHSETAIPIHNPFAFELRADPDCKSRKDCNDRGDCKNGICDCEGTAVGVHCEFPHCVNRTHCSGHGDCINMGCRCDDGFTGRSCQTKIETGCDLVCYHGGEPNAECNMCVNCLGGWIGLQCNEWSPKVSFEHVAHQLQEIAKTSHQALEDLLRKKQPPIPGKIGTGVDPTTGELKLPVVQLTYENPQKTWPLSDGKIGRYPNEATLTAMPGKYQPFREISIFQTINEQHAHLIDLRNHHKGFAGTISEWNLESPLSRFGQFYNRSVSLSLTTQYYSMYELSLPINTPDNTRSYRMDSFALKALEALPDDFTLPESQRMYEKFLSIWGSSYTVKSAIGGIAQLQTEWNTCVSEKINMQGLTRQTELDFLNQLDGLASPEANEYYIKNRQVNTLRRIGGDPTANTTDAWKDSLDGAPMQILFEYADLPELVVDPIKRNNLQMAARLWNDRHGKKEQDALNEAILQSSRYQPPRQPTC